MVEETASFSEGKIVSEPSRQNVVRELPDGQRSDFIGTRFALATTADVSGEERDVITTVLATTTGERDVEIHCQVPESLYPEYEGACNQLVATLKLTY